MTLAEQLAAVETNVGNAPLSGADVLRLVGRDALAALDRVVSQDVRSLRDSEGRLALLLAPKGQFRALMGVFRPGGEALILTPSGRGAALAEVLAAYLQFSRVAVEPLEWNGGTTLLLGPRSGDVARAAGADAGAPSGGGAVFSGGVGERLLWLGRTLRGVEGVVVTAESAPARHRLDAAMGAAGAIAVDGAVCELARIRVGFPAWGRELTETVLPPEVGIETLAISYTKGCYVGQETMARMRTYGRPTRALVGVRQVAGADVSPELPLALTAAGEEKSRGTLTSWARHPRHGGVGLALVRRELAAPGTAFSAPDRAFAVTSFPLW